MSYLTFRVPRTGLEPARLAALAPKRARLPFRHLGLHKLFWLICDAKLQYFFGIENYWRRFFVIFCHMLAP